MQQKITPHLWFDKEAKEAAGFYTSIFPQSKVKVFQPYTRPLQVTQILF
jgi:predicted 3-demethylubiquinone-9 3-methyltransferase (glyoxalase superfamily)